MHVGWREGEREKSGPLNLWVFVFPFNMIVGFNACCSKAFVRTGSEAFVSGYLSLEALCEWNIPHMANMRKELLNFGQDVGKSPNNRKGRLHEEDSKVRDNKFQSK